MRTICNPINVSYNYQRGYKSRESADPAVLVYKGEYYLFASHGEGYWVSKDLAEWEFIHIDIKKYPQFTLFAPGVCAIGDRVYLTHSQCGTMMYSDNPRDPDSWVDIGKAFEWNDPSLFCDDDGSVYIYEGLTCNGELSGARLDPDNDMKLIEGPYTLCGYDRKNRGCERRGHNNELDDATWFEGPWMTKCNGKYYLQCAAPGTEYDTYCDVCFVSDKPLGPYVYCENSPVSFKSTGFVRGCGHGCLFEDLNGNLWKVQTNDISINHQFERRISIYPAKIINDRLYVNTLRTDYPMLYPADNENPFNKPDIGWQLFSYGKTAVASSTLDEHHTPELAADECMATWWCAKTGDKGEWISLDLEKEYKVSAVQINFADQGVDKEKGGREYCTGYQYILEYSLDGETWQILVDRSENTKDMPHDYVQLEKEICLRYLKLTNLGEIPAGGLFAVSGLRVFGPACGEPVEHAPEFAVERCEDQRDMNVRIKRVCGAQGYIIRLGIAPDELYTHYTIAEDSLSDSVRIGCLNNGVKYYVAVDAYNEAGIVKGNVIPV